TAGLDDGFLEEITRHWRSEHAVNGDATGGKPEDRDVVRITSEGGDVSFHPLQGGDLVHVGVVALRLVGMFAAQRRKREEAEAPDAVVHGDKDNALPGEADARRVWRRTRAASEPASVDPDHYGQIARGRIFGTPYVQVETILRRHPRRRRTWDRGRQRSEATLHTVGP